MYQIVKQRNIWFTLSGIAVTASIVALGLWQLDFGIDFTGGSLLEVRYLNGRPDINEVRDDLTGFGLNSLVVQPAGESGVILRFQETSEEKHQEILAALDKSARGTGNGNNSNGTSVGATTTAETGGETQDSNELTMIEELRFDSVGPAIGVELKRKSVLAIFFVLVAISMYIAWVFRKVSRPVASWKYGIVALLTLFHDIIITIGVFAVLGHFYGVEVNAAFVAAILTILGYSINDSIVVFDRVRENLPKSDLDFADTVNLSINQTIARAINTSVTVMLVLIPILIFGGSTIKDFVLALSIGIFVGAYSTIFIAAPILVVWDNLMKKE